MVVPKIVVLIKREWNWLHYLRTTNEEKIIGEDDLSNGFFQEILAPNFSILLSLATAIATFGLLSNSAATIYYWGYDYCTPHDSDYEPSLFCSSFKFPSD